MTREINSNLVTASQAGSGYSMVIFAELSFPSGLVNVHSGAGTLLFESKSWLGVGNLGNISKIEEGTELRNYGIELGLSGIQTEYLSSALTEQYRGRLGRLLLALLDDGTLVQDPTEIFVGRMDMMQVVVGKLATITVRIESKLADWDRSRVDRYTNESQLHRFPGDKGLEFVSQMVEKEIVWGRS